MIVDVSLLKSAYYPCHLSWEELNDPELVINQFFAKWDLQYGRLLLKKWQILAPECSCLMDAVATKEFKLFVEDLERLVEAVLVMQIHERGSYDPFQVPFT